MLSLSLYRNRFTVTAALLALSGTMAFAQTPRPRRPRPTSPQPGSSASLPPLDQTAPIPPGGAKPASNQPEKDIDETVKEYQKIDGLFTLYRKKKDANDSLLLEVTPAQLGKLYLIQATASTGLSGVGGIYQGEPLGDIPFTLKVLDDSRVVMLVPELEHRAPRDKQMQVALDRNYPAVILYSFEIKARQKSRNTVLIDISDFFKNDIAEFAPRIGQGPSGYSLDRSFAYLDSLKSFPDNMVVRTYYRLNRQSPVPNSPRSVGFAVSYNLSLLPETGYQPRISDERVGFFTVSYTDLSDNRSYDRNVNYIRRWNLEKADLTLPLSPPKKPIVWWIDKGVPLPYRSAVRDGLLMYNKAFEAIGIKDAIVVKQMPDDADWDIADVRYNVIRWTDGNSFAVALMRSNPLTGEIVNAAIDMDNVFVQGGALQYDIQVNPQGYFPGMFATNDADHAHEAQTSENHGRGFAVDGPDVLCTREFALAAGREAEYGQTVLGLLGASGISKEELTRQYITEVVAHEMGHCLGLRHNFIASTQFSMAELQNPAIVQKYGVTASLMDYTPFNLSALNRKGVPYYQPTVGTYDKFAIDYGYRAITAATPQAELPTLRKLATKSSTPGYRFQTDRVADNYDPYISRFDLSREPLDYVEKRIDVSRYLLRTLPQRSPKPGQPYSAFTRQFNSLQGGYFSAVGYAARYIGGARISSSRVGDPNGKLPLTPLESAKQRRALNIVRQAVFAPDAFNYPKRVLAMLAPNPNKPSESTAEERRYPVLDTVSAFQKTTLMALFSPATLNRIANNEYRIDNPADTLTLATLYRTVGGDIWGELATGREITVLRRELQRAHLDLLIETITKKNADTPRDAVTLSWEQLRGLRGRIAQALPTAKGEYGTAHLQESLGRIDRVLKAQSIINE